jgi:protein-arginine kinase activator protein McsA
MICEVCNYNNATNTLEFEDGKIHVCNDCLETYFGGEDIEWQF